jgi:hypothetical protein
MTEHDIQQRLQDMTEKWKQTVDAVRMLGEQLQQARDQAYRLEGAKLTLEDMLATMQQPAQGPSATNGTDPREVPMPIMSDMNMPAPAPHQKKAKVPA